MPSQVSGPSTNPEARGSRWSWLLPAGTFLAGLALGGVVVGAGAVGGDDAPTGPATAAQADGNASGGGDGSAGGDPADARDTGLYVRVPDSCVRTADDATTLVEHVDRVVAAVADLEPERLRQTVDDDVQAIRDEVSDVAEQCRAAAEQRLQDAGTAEVDDAIPPTPAS